MQVRYYKIIRLVCLTLASRYLEYVKNYLYIKEIDKPFYKTQFLLYAFLEIMTYLIFQYPNMSNYLVIIQLGNTFILPLSSVLASLCIFRLCYSFKLFKNLTKWTSLQSENICDNYACEASSSFAFKALQKEYPFITLTLIFLLTCICFGFSLRIYELFYWEGIQNKHQDWTYSWNAVWCIFVSMTTVGYGDFFPKTHFGRFIVIIACIIGTYFVSMLMVFMTQKSILDETEFKAFKLITRLRLRKEIKFLQANLIYESMLMSKNKMNEESYKLHKRNVYILIEEIKSKMRRIKTFEFAPTKEQLFDVCERIDNDMNEIINEVESLKILNEDMITYTDNQVEVVKYLKKNIYSMKLIYKTIDKNKKFGKLNNLDLRLIQEDDDFDKTENLSETKKSESEEDDKIDLTLYNLEQEDLRAHFEFIISKPDTVMKSKYRKNTSINKKSTNFLISPLKKLRKNTFRKVSSFKD